MIHSLYVDNGIKHFDVRFDFETGLTVIVGPNESGKSLILEFIRYALFGTPALRGKASDYKGLKVHLNFRIKGLEYRVERDNGNAKLFRDEEQVATGASVINAKIPEILGYGLKVFDMANCAMQDEVLALGNMKPAERKQAVDSVIGLNVLDNLVTWVKEEGKNLRDEAEILSKNLVAPEEPVKPEGYKLSADLKNELDALRALEEERFVTLAFLANPVQEPVEPTCSVTLDLQKLEANQRLRKTVLDQNNKIRAELATIPEARYTEEDLDGFLLSNANHKAWNAYQAHMATMPEKPDGWTWERLEQAERDRTRRTRWAVIKAQFEQHKVSCPNCQHEFLPMVSPEDQELLNNPPEKTVDCEADLEAIRRALKAWDEHETSGWNALSPCDPSPLSDAEIQHELDVIKKQSRRVELTAMLEDTVIPEDLSNELAERKVYEAEFVAYQSRVEKWKTWQEQAALKTARLEEIGEPNPLPVQVAYDAARLYEGQVETFAKARSRYDDLLQTVTEKQGEAQQHKLAADALLDLKVRIKQYLVPSLNKVASSLLSQMTGGARSVIEVTEDFDIFVDGQELRTLSGSGKAVANLALRIGLGQVLTHKTFNVFMADEIDGSMDAERAGFTAECLQRLTRHIGQILLVSHKTPEADHYIELEG